MLLETEDVADSLTQISGAIHGYNSSNISIDKKDGYCQQNVRQHQTSRGLKICSRSEEIAASCVSTS